MLLRSFFRGLFPSVSIKRISDAAADLGPVAAGKFISADGLFALDIVEERMIIRDDLIVNGQIAASISPGALAALGT